jgi:hypothetical protein
MLTLKYQSQQSGPQYYFQIESSLNFLSKDLVIIAYSSSGTRENIPHIGQDRLSSFKYAVGSIFTSFSQPAYTMLAASFSVPEVSYATLVFIANAEDPNVVVVQNGEDDVFRHRHITISLMRNTCNESDGVCGGNLVAIAHFHAEVESEVKSTPALEHKGTDADVRECKFDTLTFEQLGGIVRLPVKRTKVRKYENCEPRLLKICQVEVMNDDPYYFPIDVFDHDVEFVDLPGKV